MKKLSQTYGPYMKGGKFSAKRQRREERERTDAATRGASSERPVYIVQPTAVITSRSRTAVSSAPRRTRGAFLTSTGSSVGPKDLRRTKSSPGVRPTRKGPVQAGAFEYKTVTMGETDAEKAVRDNLLEETKEKNWVEGQKSRVSSAYVTPTNSLGLTPRKYSVRPESADRRLRDVTRVSFKTSGHFCDRALRLENGDFSKQFCDVFGPGMCSDCTRARRQHISIEDHVQSFPGISVSPYLLCVQSDDETFRTPSASPRERDALYRRSLRRASPNTPATLGSVRARPNSSNDVRTNTPASDVPSSVPFFINDADTLSADGSWRPLRRSESPSSSISDSRRSSVSLSEESNAQATRDGSDDTVSRTTTGNEPAIPAALDRLLPGIAQERRGSARPGSRFNSGRDRMKTPTIERRGKLKELPYWRFLIPEPPKMEVGRMNVSIYTPKEIPGIKIFDESFFNI